MILVNVVLRSLVVVVGVFIALALPPFTEVPSPLHEVFGIVVILFGIYRILTFYTAMRRSKS